MRSTSYHGVYGFKGLAEDFLISHPGHHINPQRVTGSGVETLFGQLKHTTSGNLTAQYEMAKATMLTKGMIQGRKPTETPHSVLDKQNFERNSILNIR